MSLESKMDGRHLSCGSKPSVSWSVSLLTLSVVFQLISFKNQARLLKMIEFEALFAKR